MKQNTINARRLEFRRAILAAGIDPDADFFTLPFSDLARLADLAKVFPLQAAGQLPGVPGQGVSLRGTKSKIKTSRAVNPGGPGWPGGVPCF